MSRPVAVLLLSALLPATAVAGEHVGPETCKACHPAAYQAWREGPHARALASLPEQSRKDRRCLSCHAPDLEEGISAVSCEACHGPGRIYAAPYVMRDPELARAVGLADPGEKTCLACHTESTPSLERFDYARKLPLIVHWGEASGNGKGAPRQRPAEPARPATPAGR